LFSYKNSDLLNIYLIYYTTYFFSDPKEEEYIDMQM